MVIVNGFQPFNYHHKVLHLGCCSSPRSGSVSAMNWIKKQKTHGVRHNQIEGGAGPTEDF